MQKPKLTLRSKLRIYWGNVVCTSILAAIASPVALAAVSYFDWQLSVAAWALVAAGLLLLSIAVAMKQIKLATSERVAVTHDFELPTPSEAA